ncbi:uncharacterized protein CCOS01_02880 [Colletotrichum costaricense]|uniref:Uncharacterized protein n=1 Tax=Colletotrichum costaricense TaxID=1209916 RepID=A0AAJ0E561_9PEZI|nr:uncharacterized protein CCOS01_02880 [Colletotrichum costaricense]KAI3552631.1 hypothetical protein CSPX01_00380 [Colletotrichum filicis]KAK1534128.1 hypothetical protein CCOS01_02880 [Colletotrichum costaricense]
MICTSCICSPFPVPPETVLSTLKSVFCFLFPSFDPQLLVSLTRCLSRAAQDLFSNRPVQEATRLPSATIIAFQPTPSPRCLDAAATRRGVGGEDTIPANQTHLLLRMRCDTQTYKADPQPR